MFKKTAYFVPVVLLLSFAVTGAFADMVAYYPMDEGAGTLIKDFSGFGHDGEAQTEPNWVDSATNFGKAIYFDGADPTPYWINCGRWNPSEETGELSVTCWIKWAGINGSWQGIVGKRDGWDVVDNVAQTMWYLEVSTNGDMKFSSRGDDILDTQFGQIPPENEWCHLGVSFDGTDIALFVDGEQVESFVQVGGIEDPSAKFQFGPKTDSTITIGCDNLGGANAFWGTIDEVRLFNEALSQDDISYAMFDVGVPAGLARAPKPKNEQKEVARDTALGWRAGLTAVTHDLYFGTDFNDVNEATPDDPRGVLIQQGMTDNNYEPPNLLEFDRTYYWRVDEINDLDPNAPWRGDVWSFTVADYDVLDDFESYDEENIIYEIWEDYYVNNTGMTVGYFDPPYIEREQVHGGKKSMPLKYDNDGTVNEETTLETSGTLFYSQAERQLPETQDWTQYGLESLSLWLKGYPAYSSSFAEEPGGKYTITAAGADIWNTADEFHFAYKELASNQTVTIIAKVESLEPINKDSKAGIMIRDSLEPGARNAALLLTPDPEKGLRFQTRVNTDGGTARGDNDMDPNAMAPYWLKLERAPAGIIRTGYSVDGENWESFSLKVVTMTSPIYIGLAVTSHDSAQTCEAVFSNVTIDGTGGEKPWSAQDIGIPVNDPQPVYAVLNGNTGAAVYHDDPNASLISSWTEWNIPLQKFADKGADLTNVSSVGIGVGDIGSQEPAGEGMLYIDDIRLYIPRETAEPNSPE
ncbi:MAG: LamG domain-containing protein [Sedimentisphaerales bacterium]|nr:LamG domain-containing protein [Sedimentisphaerales bacterium]